MAVSPGRNDAIKDEVRALTGRDHRLNVRVGQFPDAVGKRAGGVDDYLGADLKFGSRLGVASAGSRDKAVVAFDEFNDGRVVEQSSALLKSGGDHVESAGGSRRIDRHSR